MAQSTVGIVKTGSMSCSCLYPRSWHRTATEMGAITEPGGLAGRLGLVGACLIHPSLIHHLKHHYVTDVEQVFTVLMTMIMVKLLNVDLEKEDEW